MLLMVGGAPRAGKGVISRACIDRLAVPVLSLDVLKMGLHHAVPSVGVESGADPSDVGTRMWPLVRAMAHNVVESGLDYLFEGDMLLPRHVAELHELAAGSVRSCFVGYKGIDPAEKVRLIRNHAALPNDWLSEHNDEYVLEVVQYGINFSRRLHGECRSLGIAYFDGSADFMSMVQSAVGYLVVGE